MGLKRYLRNALWWLLTAATIAGCTGSGNVLRDLFSHHDPGNGEGFMGVVDRSFAGGRGYVTATTLGQIGNGTVNAAGMTDIMLGASGKIYLGGNTFLSPSNFWHIVLFGFLSDGTPDPSLSAGSTGEVIVDQQTFFSVIRLLPQRADGTFVVAGHRCQANVCTPGLIHFNPDGSLDPNFNASAPLAPSAEVRDAVAIGQKYYLAGVVSPDTNGSQAFVACFNSDGTLDTTFGSGGVLIPTAPNGSGPYGADSLALQGTSQLLAGGFVTPPGQLPVAAVFRVSLSGGTLDPTFGPTGGGWVISPPFYKIRSLAVEPNGNFAASSTIFAGGVSWDGVIVHYLAGGSIDTAFGQGGKFILDRRQPGYADFAQCQNFTVGLGALALEPDGKFLTGGSINCTDTGSAQVAPILALVTSDGVLSGPLGVIRLPMSAGVTRILVQPDGKPLVLGSASNSYTNVSVTDLFRLRYPW